MKDEGKVKDFLGICVVWDPQNGTIMLTQPGLIDSVLNDLGLLSTNSTPVKHKYTWSKTSGEERETHHPVVQLGECISVNMMTSPTPRLVAQMLGKPTCKRYCHAAIYIDQAMGLGFVWLQKSVNLGDTMEGKITFERFCQEHGITIQLYHADNGISAPTHGGNCAYNKDRASPLPESQCITKRALLRGGSGNSKR